MHAEPHGAHTFNRRIRKGRSLGCVLLQSFCCELLYHAKSSLFFPSFLLLCVFFRRYPFASCLIPIMELHSGYGRMSTGAQKSLLWFRHLCWGLMKVAGLRRLYLSQQLCSNGPKGASSRWRRNSFKCILLFITSCRRLNSGFTALQGGILWMWPQGVEKRNFNTPPGEYYSTPKCEILPDN